MAPHGRPSPDQQLPLEADAAADERLHRFPDDATRDIKDDIESGMYRREMFWLARQFFRYLQRLPPAFTRLHPIPPRIRQETENVLNPSRLEPLRSFLENQTTGAVKYSLGGTVEAIKTAFLAELLCGNDLLKKLMREVGIEEHSNGSVRVLTWLYPGARRKQAIALRP